MCSFFAPSTSRSRPLRPSSPQLFCPIPSTNSQNLCYLITIDVILLTWSITVKTFFTKISTTVYILNVFSQIIKPDILIMKELIPFPNEIILGLHRSHFPKVKFSETLYSTLLPAPLSPRRLWSTFSTGRIVLTRTSLGLMVGFVLTTGPMSLPSLGRLTVSSCLRSEVL